MNTTRTAFLSALALLATLSPTPAQNMGAAFSNTVDGYIEVPYSPQVVPKSGITVEAWITYDDATLGTGYRYPTIVRQGISVGGSEDYFLRVNADNIGAKILRWKVVTATSSPTISWTFTAGQLLTWTHVAATYDGATAVLYVNGVPVGTAPGSGPIRDLNSEVFRIGKGSDVATPIEVWNGQIDEVRLWPFARTQAEIQATMNEELLAVPGLVSTWNLNGNLLDSSSTMHGTAGGTFVPSATAPVLTTPGFAGLPSGTSTPGCLGALSLAPTSTPTALNLAFGAVCTRTPPNALVGWGIAFAVIPTPFPLLGVDVFLDTAGMQVTTVTANSLGAARLGMPIGAAFPPGFAWAVQSMVLDPCGPQGYTASNALSLAVLP
ncbi:MAG: LamG domain-containing protein [Planctomycetes bacterium]|nr:LamG domain-containing protein [Planctomycetota bacterium]